MQGKALEHLALEWASASNMSDRAVQLGCGATAAVQSPHNINGTAFKVGCLQMHSHSQQGTGCGFDVAHMCTFA